MTAPTPQRQRLRFCKAFFEIAAPGPTREALLRAGAQALSSDDGDEARELARDQWYWWSEAERKGRTRASFVIRIRADSLILEGPTPEAVGRGWRQLDAALRPHAKARVAAGDDLQRFLPASRAHSGDRPESWSRAYEQRVLSEFYADFCARWARSPQHRLDGRSPREAAGDPELRPTLERILAGLERVEEERRSRGMPSISTAELAATVFGDEEGS